MCLPATGISEISIKNGKIYATDIAAATNKFIWKKVIKRSDYRPRKKETYILKPSVGDVLKVNGTAVTEKQNLSVIYSLSPLVTRCTAGNCESADSISDSYVKKLLLFVIAWLIGYKCGLAVHIWALWFISMFIVVMSETWPQHRELHRHPSPATEKSRCG